MVQCFRGAAVGVDEPRPCATCNRQGGEQVLRLEFTSLDEAKFRKWLVNWGGGIVTNGAAVAVRPLLQLKTVGGGGNPDTQTNPAHLGSDSHDKRGRVGDPGAESEARLRV